MVSEVDIYRSANQVIRLCGTRRNPVEYAQGQMTQLYEKGDAESATVWARVGNAIDELRDRSYGGVVH